MIPYFLSTRRLSAWILVQALFLSQILSPFANAQEGEQTLKVQEPAEGTVRPILEAGLEERVVTVERIAQLSSWRDLFGNDLPVELEIGVGDGTRFLARAKAEQVERNFVGVELPDSVWVREGGLVAVEAPPNVRFLWADARQILDHLSSLRLDAITIEFPPPESYRTREETLRSSFLYDPPEALVKMLELIKPGGRFTLLTESGAAAYAVQQAAAWIGVPMEGIQREEIDATGNSAYGADGKLHVHDRRFDPPSNHFVKLGFIEEQPLYLVTISIPHKEEAGLEERVVATPVDRAVPPTFQGKELDSPEGIRALMDALEAGYRATGQGHVSVNHPVDRVASWRNRQKGEGRLWEEIPPEVREPLQTLYDLRYDLIERPAEETLDDPAVATVIGSLNSPHQAIADAARDVIMAVRARGLTGTLGRIAREYQRQSGGFGSYARLSYTDALSTFVDPAFPGELGNPYRPLFDEHSLPPEAIHEALQFLFDPDSKKSWLKSFSGIRGPFTKAMIDGAMRRDDKGELRGFPVTDLQTDAATQLHDAAKVAVAHIVREFVQFALPMMAEKEKWKRIGVLMDPRDTGPAVWQVVARTLLKLGVEVEFAGIGSAPESAARALLSRGQVDSVIFISSSHVQQGTNGFKLMLKTGQILPVSEARAFIDHFIEKGKDPANTRELIRLLTDPADAPLNDRIAEIQRGMPQAYLESKRLYGAYGDSVLAGVPMSEPARVEQRKRAIREELARLKVIFLYDANGGSGVTDVEFLRSWAPFLITVNDRIRLFSHDLAPWEGSTAQAKAIAKKLEPELARRGYTLMVFGTDTDRDRRFMLPRNPHTREYDYPGPQALFSIDAVYHALTNAGKKPAVVGNDPTTARMELLAPAMGFRFEKGEVGEANVVAVLQWLVGLGYKTMGGEGSNASTFGDEVLVRDLLLALGSAFAFMGDPELTRTLIRQVAQPEERESLLAQVEEWYRSENLPDLFYHILEDVLPPEAVTDTFDPTEARRGTGTPATQAEIAAKISRQKRYKDALDRVMEQEFLPAAMPGIARIIAEVSGEGVSASQISYKIANYEGTERLEGFGNRKGHEGGYLLELTYTDQKGEPHFLGWVWTRESQTETGVARRIVDMVSDFLPREKGRQLVNQLYAFLYPKWSHTLDRVEILAMENLLEELSPENAVIRQLSRQAEETRGNNLEVRHDLGSKYANPDKPESRSANVEQNLRSESKEVDGALAQMRELMGQLDSPLAEIRRIARGVLKTGRIEAEQAQQTEAQMGRLRHAVEITPSPAEPGRVVALPLAPAAEPLSGDAELDRFGRSLVQRSANWLIGRAIGSLGPVSEATPQMLVEWADRLAGLSGQLQQIARRPVAHYPQAHLVAADIHLAQHRAELLAERVRSVPAADRVLALELGGTFLRLALVDRRNGQMLLALPDYNFHFPYSPPRDWKNSQPLLWQIVQRVRSILELAGLRLEEVGSVSVSSPGDLDESTGFITLQNNLPFTGENLVVILREKLAVTEKFLWGQAAFLGPVLLSNDMNTAVRAEVLFGTAKGRKAAGYVTVSSGTNAAFYTPEGKAVDLGLWGYKAYDDKTVEEHTSGTHLARLAREMAESPDPGKVRRAARIVELAGGDPGKIEGKHVGQAFTEEDPLAMELVQNAARVLGRAVVEATWRMAEQDQLSDEPDVLWIFGGGVSVGLGKPFRDLIQQRVDAERAARGIRTPVRVALSQMNGAERGLLGAAARAQEVGAGLEEIPLPAGATQGQIFFVGPGVAQPPLWNALRKFAPAPGERIPLLIFARDMAQRMEIERSLERERGGFWLAEPVISVQDEYEGNLQRALEERAAHYRAQDANLQVRRVLTVDDLSDLGAWLRIPDISVRALVDRVREGLLQQQL